MVYFILTASSANFVSTTVGQVTDMHSPIQVNDQIVEVNGKKVYMIQDIQDIFDQYTDGDVTVKVKRNNEIITLQTKPVEDKTANIGIYFGKKGETITTEILGVQSGSIAEKAGIQEKDTILKINDIEVNNDPYKVAELMNEYGNSEITITLERKNEILDIKVTPQIISVYYLGVKFYPAEKNIGSNLYYGFWDTKDFAFSIIDNLKMLFTGQVKADQLMGPIGISDVVAQTNGWYDFIYILALVSLSLGVTNLLPFPPLDGGKIILLLIEAVRKKPIKEDIEIGIQMIGFMLLIGLSIYVAYNDVLRLF